MHEGRRVTAKDVAQAARVSRTAVSFAFNDPARISQQTRQRILRVAEELGYVPNPIARALVRGSTRSLGVLLPQDIPLVMENPYYAQFLVGLGQVCDREGLSLLLVPPLRSSMRDAIPYAAVDGFVVCGLATDRGEITELRRRGVPFVLVDSDELPGVPSIEVTEQAGIAELVGHLLELGHRRLAVLSLPAGGSGSSVPVGPLARRMAGIADALGVVGMSLDHPDVRVVEVASTRAEGYRATSELMAGPRPPSAVVALSDILAVGALDALRDLGVDVPGQVSVAGFDDLPEANWVRPALTTVRQPIQAKGRVAGDFLVASIQGERPHSGQVLHTALIVRESTGPVHPSASG
ncbi:LacI family DNA-binding transcriptional regulator [Goodfellowiella coeruleoviolacea]|uniref:Transcriptional regulator, LacI family n=1 Tax=Goodfellowiella coeruleoviolacea TaxID=334858 RepID=A0AAE3G8P7_9PSEU|nr:LacI family DNA-binding transcriptional regulator [Goodfellowiella coeruleoviolacea]MCP2163766.1 transcriptional regulator, LacI family [Goodfellowiella coeruleoviolacea]